MFMRERNGFAKPALIALIALLLVSGTIAYITLRDGSGEVLRETPLAQSTYEVCVAKCRDQYGGSGSAGFDACVRACGAGSSAKVNGESAEEKACDFSKYKGVGCEAGYKCFRGVDIVCGPPRSESDDCLSRAVEVGDGLCHSVCDQDNDCMVGFECVPQKAFSGDVVVVDDKLCMRKAVSTQSTAIAGNEYQGSIIAGASAPLFDFVKADYDKARTSGKLIVLYFYANWCPLCVEEVSEALYPIFHELTRDDVIGFRVNYNDSDTDENEKNLAREFGVAYQHTKVFVKNGVRILKSPESWDKARYVSEIEKAANN